MIVARFASHGGIDHANEMANKVRQTSKQLKECQTMAQTYNNRERLFGMTVTNVSKTVARVKGFLCD